MTQKPSDLHYEIDFQKKISRLFVFRFLWMAIEMWVIWVWSVWMGILFFLHFFYMLVAGQRHKGIWERNVRFMRHLSKWGAYFHWLTNKRPKFIED